MQRLPEAAPGVRLFVIRPYHARQPCAIHVTICPERKQGEQPEPLAGPKLRNGVSSDPYFHRAEETNHQPFRGLD